jgi:4a-hydroxytetrahydrobiopterin dehydratase
MSAQAKKLSDGAIQKKLGKLKGWRHENDSITREFVLGSFSAATRFVASIAPIANRMDHHPDVQIHRYKRVKIMLTTHDADGITEADFTLAAKIDALPV